jgi:transposase
MQQGFNSSGPPCMWWTHMLTLVQVRELLALRFGIDHTARALQNVLHDLGLRPWHTYVDRNTLHGRVGYYDPVV